MQKSLMLLLGLLAGTTAFAFSCEGRPYCKNMSSCAEAQYQLNVCGYHKLDRDGDGIPCENVCGKGSGKVHKSKGSKKASKAKTKSVKSTKAKRDKRTSSKKSLKIK